MGSKITINPHPISDKYLEIHTYFIINKLHVYIIPLSWEKLSIYHKCWNDVITRYINTLITSVFHLSLFTLFQLSFWISISSYVNFFLLLHLQVHLGKKIRPNYLLTLKHVLTYRYFKVTKIEINSILCYFKNQNTYQCLIYSLHRIEKFIHIWESQFFFYIYTPINKIMRN